MLVTTVESKQETLSPACSALVTRLASNVEHIAQPRHLWAQPEANRRTREWIADTLRALGYAVSVQGRYRNVIAVPNRPDRAVPRPLSLPLRAGGPPALPAVCAHYDSVPTTPGADDNGSAIAVMLEVARAAVLAEVPIALIAFNAEEDDLAGSRDFAARYESSGSVAGARLSVAHVLEMVGYTAAEQRRPDVPKWLAGALPTVGDFIGVVANRGSARQLKRVLAEAQACPAAPPVVGLRAYLGAERLLPDILRSDHAPLWRVGIPALMWTDTAEFRNPHYHRPSDTPDTLDYAFMARVVALLLGSVGIRA